MRACSTRPVGLHFLVFDRLDARGDADKSDEVGAAGFVRDFSARLDKLQADFASLKAQLGELAKGAA